MLISHGCNFVAITWKQFHNKCPSRYSLYRENYIFKMTASSTRGNWVERKKNIEYLAGIPQENHQCCHKLDCSWSHVFPSLSCRLFRGGRINWGRIITLLCFGYRMAVTVLQRGIHGFFSKIIGFVCKFILVENIAKWIAEQGGWVSVIFYMLCMHEHIEAWTKWPTFCRPHFQMYFPERKILYIEISFEFVVVWMTEFAITVTSHKHHDI